MQYKILNCFTTTQQSAQKEQKQEQDVSKNHQKNNHSSFKCKKKGKSRSNRFIWLSLR